MIFYGTLLLSNHLRISSVTITGPRSLPENQPLVSRSLEAIPKHLYSACAKQHGVPCPNTYDSGSFNAVAVPPARWQRHSWRTPSRTLSVLRRRLSRSQMLSRGFLHDLTFYEDLVERYRGQLEGGLSEILTCLLQETPFETLLYHPCWKAETDNHPTTSVKLAGDTSAVCESPALLRKPAWQALQNATFASGLRKSRTILAMHLYEACNLLPTL